MAILEGAGIIPKLKDAPEWVGTIAFADAVIMAISLIGMIFFKLIAKPKKVAIILILFSLIGFLMVFVAENIETIITIFSYFIALVLLVTGLLMMGVPNASVRTTASDSVSSSSDSSVTDAPQAATTIGYAKIFYKSGAKEDIIELLKNPPSASRKFVCNMRTGYSIQYADDKKTLVTNVRKEIEKNSAVSKVEITLN